MLSGRPFLEHQVLFFREQRLTRSQQITFGERFGDLRIFPALRTPNEYPQVGSIKFVGTGSSRREGEGVRTPPGLIWHMDILTDEAPPAIGMVYMREVPDIGGDSVFCSMSAAYEALSAPVRKFLAGLTAVHSGFAFLRGRELAYDVLSGFLKNKT